MHFCLGLGLWAGMDICVSGIFCLDVSLDPFFMLFNPASSWLVSQYLLYPRILSLPQMPCLYFLSEPQALGFLIDKWCIHTIHDILST